MKGCREKKGSEGCGDVGMTQTDEGKREEGKRDGKRKRMYE